MSSDSDKFFATQTGKIVFSAVLLIIGFFGGMEYKSYQIRSVITDSLAPAIMNSLDDSRTKADDAKAESYLSSARAQGELSATTNARGVESYTGVCSDSQFRNLLEGAQSAGGGSYTCNVAPDGTAWAASVPLKSDPSTYYCSDSTGKAVTIYSPLGSASSCQ